MVKLIYNIFLKFILNKRNQKYIIGILLLFLFIKILLSLSITFWFLIFIIAMIFNKYLSAQIKGYIGEYKLIIRIKMFLKEKYHLINDILVETEYGLTQIDHILISKRGIFVIETKNSNKDSNNDYIDWGIEDIQEEPFNYDEYYEQNQEYFRDFDT